MSAATLRTSAVATSDGQCFHGVGMRPGAQRRVRHLQRRLARQTKGSTRRRRTVRAIGRILERERNRCTDLCHQMAHTLTTQYGLSFWRICGSRT